MKSLKIAVQMDPLHSIDITGDSTFALMLEAQARGHKLWHYEVPHMWLDGARLKARVKPVTVQAVPGAHHEFGPEVDHRPVGHGRGADAPGPALRHGLHHRHPHAGAYPPATRWW